MVHRIGDNSYSLNCVHRHFLFHNNILKENPKLGDESTLLGHLKLQLLKEEDLLPYLSIGVKDLNNIKKHRSMFLSFNKKLNLPKIHIFGVHFGIVDDYYGCL